MQSVKGFPYKREGWSFDALHPCETAGLGGPRHTDPCDSWPASLVSELLVVNTE